MQESSEVFLLDQCDILNCEKKENEIAFQERAEKLFLWVKNTSKDLSELGINLHIQDPVKKFPIEAAKTIVEIAKAGVDRHTVLIKEVLGRIRKEIPDTCEVANSYVDTQTQRNITRTEYAKKEILRSSVCEYDGIELLSNKDVLDYIVEEKDPCFPFSEHHLRCIEKLWKLLRVQIIILTIQLYSVFPTTFCDSSKYDCEDKVPRSSVHPVYSASKPNLNLLQFAFRRNILEQTSGEEENSLVPCFNSVCTSELSVTEEETDCVFCLDEEDKFSLCSFCCRQSMSSDRKHNVQDDNKNNIGVESVPGSNQTSPRDDGYCSKAGESVTEDTCSNFDSRSVETDLISQDAHILSSEPKLELDEKNPDVGLETNWGAKPSSTSTDSTSSSNSIRPADSWDEIYEVVERFSQNTLTLLSWIDELKDVSKSDGNSACFFDSQHGRKESITKHAERIHNDVINDAVTLLQHLPSEKDTIDRVLKTVELQCSAFGVSLPSDIPEITLIAGQEKRLDPGFLSSKLKRDLDQSLLSYPDFKPQMTSSPYQKSKPLRNGIGDKAKRSPRNTTLKHTSEPTFNLQNQRPGRAGRDRNPLLWSLNTSSRRNWNEFMNEWESVYDWLERMDMRIHQAEMSDLTSAELAVLFEKYMHQFKINNSRRECLNIKANYVGTMYPELDYYVHDSLLQIDDLWNDLKLRLCDYLTPLSRWRRHDPPYDKEHGSGFYPKHRSSQIDFKRSSDTFDPFAIYPKLQMSDFTFNQIRDNLSIDGFAEEDGKSQKPISNTSNFASGHRNKNLFPTSEELEFSASTIYRFNRLDGGARWAESERLGSDVTDSFGPQIKRNQKSPTVGDASVADKNCKSRKDLLRDVIVKDVISLDTSSSEESTDEDVVTTNEEESLITAQSLLEANPQLLSSRIKEFHLWLKTEEQEAYERCANKCYGWDPVVLEQMLFCNENRLKHLAERKETLKRICSSSEQILHLHLREISEYFLIWSTWMIQLRYYNLILFSVDMECILERRIEILSKKNSLNGRLSHPLDGAWVDRGEDMIPTIDTTDKDYDIFFRL